MKGNTETSAEQVQNPWISKNGLVRLVRQSPTDLISVVQSTTCWIFLFIMLMSLKSNCSFHINVVHNKQICFHSSFISFSSRIRIRTVSELELFQGHWLPSAWLKRNVPPSCCVVLNSWREIRWERQSANASAITQPPVTDVWWMSLQNDSSSLSKKKPVTCFPCCRFPRTNSVTHLQLAFYTADVWRDCEKTCFQSQSFCLHLRVVVLHLFVSL